ncbi:hypothetical protein C7974DRAFT_322140 [Boeremia exigua]|uniref:uncharacterized protein n=1 Tax=Boeremia exigua TaxID=749465 RepID=UPI001E8E5F0B|nr:uncharacterized protein C7974DRAFT_322140 [Boeremia exigua]KAH6613087.1 hypothetical protein C7974DRAFT_322140 [Boeremia exigua]
MGTDRPHFAGPPGSLGPDSKRHHQSATGLWGKSWTAETCSYIVSIIALGGLTATLLVHQNKPLPQWPQLVTINSIISLFSLVMRACVGVVLAEGISQCKWNWYQKAKKLDHIERLDSASRGSWGAFTLLYHFRPKQAYYIATLGAMTMILASLTGFFSQQLVQFHGCLERDADAFADIARTNSYSQTGGLAQNNVATEYPQMLAAINVGVLQPTGDQTNALSSGCSTGNCTFSDANNASFSTVAISHTCEDLTPRIHVVNETRNSSTAPDSKYLGIDYGDNEAFEWLEDMGGIVVKSWVDSSSSPASSDLTTIYFLFRSNSSVTDWKVTNCSLYPTVNTYAASIKDARLDENLTESIPLRSISEQFVTPPVVDIDLSNMQFMWTYKMATNLTTRNGMQEQCEGSDKNRSGLVYFPKSSDEPTYVNSTGHTNPSAGWKWWYYPRNCIWSLHRFSAASIAETLGEVFNLQEATNSRKGGVMGAAHLRVLFQGGNITHNTIDAQIKNLATAMTTVVRTAGGDGTLTYTPDYAQGLVWTNTTCVSIRWPWITFPAILISLTGLFLALVAFENRGVESDRLWKSSFLAAIFCEVDIDTNERPVGKADMKAVAKSTSVSLEGKSGTLRLVAG